MVLGATYKGEEEGGLSARRVTRIVAALLCDTVPNQSPFLSISRPLLSCIVAPLFSLSLSLSTVHTCAALILLLFQLV